MTYSHLWADCLYSGLNARWRVWEAFTFLLTYLLTFDLQKCKCLTVWRSAKSGRSCRLDGQVYLDGQEFKPNCSQLCTCQDGVYACASLCPQELRPPSTTHCQHAQLVPVDGQCCREWVCPHSFSLPGPDDDHIHPGSLPDRDGSCIFLLFITLAVSTGKRNATVWRPSVCLSVRRHSHQGQHATRPTYISARQQGRPTNLFETF